MISLPYQQLFGATHFRLLKLGSSVVFASTLALVFESHTCDIHMYPLDLYDTIVSQLQSKFRDPFRQRPTSLILLASCEDTPVLWR